MLVLSRKVGERLLLGDEIVITVVRIGPDKVRLGIDAPDNMNILREELANESICESEQGGETGPTQSASWPPRTSDSVD